MSLVALAFAQNVLITSSICTHNLSDSVAASSSCPSSTESADVNLSTHMHTKLNNISENKEVANYLAVPSFSASADVNRVIKDASCAAALLFCSAGSPLGRQFTNISSRCD